MINLIVAMDKNGCIGKNNQIPWYIPEDLQRFKRLTENKTVIMGKNTWLSLPKKPLKNRKNIVISNSIRELNGAEVYSSLDCAIENNLNSEVWLIGGARIYEEGLKYNPVMYVTIVDTVIENGDTFFPIQKLKEYDTKIVEYKNSGNYRYSNIILQ